MPRVADTAKWVKINTKKPALTRQAGWEMAGLLPSFIDCWNFKDVRLLASILPNGGADLITHTVRADQRRVLFA